MRKRRARRAKRVAIINKLAAFSFLYLVFFTAHFSMITLSKYIGKSTGEGNSHIAKWEVSLDTTDNESDTLSIIAGDTTPSYTLKLTSTSETKTIYSIVLSNLPNGLEAKLDEGVYQESVNNTITFSDIGYINASTEPITTTHTLTFNFSADANIVGENEINIDVIFNQANPT